MQVLQSDEEVQRNIAPFLKSKVLREIVRSFTSNNDFEQWAKNTQVLDMLREAQRLLDNGYVTEQQLQKSLLAHLEVCCMDWSLMSQNKATAWGNPLVATARTAFWNTMMLRM